jgi:tetratricopeptide (TPR) repeat protein
VNRALTFPALLSHPPVRPPGEGRGEGFWAGVFALLLLATLIAAPAGAQTPQLEPIPPVDTSTMEPAVREQIEAERRSLEEARKRLPAGSPELAEAFGRCGQVHALYKLNEPARACFENAVRLAPADARWAYYLGALLQTAGELAAAEAQLARAVELQPRDPAALVRLGEVRLRLGRLDEARRAFEAALPLDGAAAAAHFGLGRVALARGDARAAAGHFETVLASQPGASEVRSPLAAAYRKLGRLEDARRALAGYGEGRVTFPDPLMDRLAGLNAGSRQYVVAGTTALRERRFAGAAEAFRKALESGAGEDATVWANYGVALERLGDPAGAERSYRKALEIQPANVRARYNLGTLLASRGEHREGIEHLEAAARHDPESRDVLFNLGQALAEAGEPARALEVYDRLLALSPQDAVARFQRARALSALGRHAESAAELGTVIAAAPGEVAPRAAQAEALLLAGRDAEARARLEEGLTRLPGSEALALLLVRVLAASPRPEVRDGKKALEIAERLLAAGPNVDREEAMALALGEVGRFAEAADHQRRALAGAGPEAPGRGRLERCLALYASGKPCRSR